METISKGKQLIKYISGGDDFNSMWFSLEYKWDIQFELYAAKEKIPFEEVVFVSSLITKSVEVMPAFGGCGWFALACASNYYLGFTQHWKVMQDVGMLPGFSFLLDIVEKQKEDSDGVMEKKYWLDTQMIEAYAHYKMIVVMICKSCNNGQGHIVCYCTVNISITEDTPFVLLRIDGEHFDWLPVHPSFGVNRLREIHEHISAVAIAEDALSQYWVGSYQINTAINDTKLSNDSCDKESVGSDDGESGDSDDESDEEPSSGDHDEDSDDDDAVVDAIDHDSSTSDGDVTEASDEDEDDTHALNTSTTLSAVTDSNDSASSGNTQVKSYLVSKKCGYDDKYVSVRIMYTSISNTFALFF